MVYLWCECPPYTCNSGLPTVNTAAQPDASTGPSAASLDSSANSGLQSRSAHLRTVALVEAALLLDIVVLLVLVRTYLPIPGFQGALRLVCPAPFILLGLRRGVRTCGLATVSAYVLLSTLIGPVLAIQILVFGSLGCIFTYVSRRQGPQAIAVVLGAAVYGVLYLLVPFVLGLWLLRISPQTAIDAVTTQMHHVAGFFARLHLLPLAHLADWLAVHWVAAYIVSNIIYSLVNIWAYLVVTRELFRLLPAEVRADAQGQSFDFYP